MIFKDVECIEQGTQLGYVCSASEFNVQGKDSIQHFVRRLLLSHHHLDVRDLCGAKHAYTDNEASFEEQ